jgi:hypothetical protein
MTWISQKGRFSGSVTNGGSHQPEDQDEEGEEDDRSDEAEVVFVDAVSFHSFLSSVCRLALVSITAAPSMRAGRLHLALIPPGRARGLVRKAQRVGSSKK